MFNKLTWSSIALLNLSLSWIVYVLCFFPFVITEIGYWLMFLMAIGGVVSTYRLLTGNSRALAMQLVCSIGVMLMELLRWVWRLYHFAYPINEGMGFLVGVDVALMTHLFNSGKAMQGIQLVLWNILPFWIVLWTIIYTRIKTKGMK